MGEGDLAEKFLLNCQAEDEKQRLIYLIEDGYNPDDYWHLEKRGIKVLGLDFEHPAYVKNLSFLRRYRLREAQALISFDEEQKGFAKLEALNAIFSQMEGKPLSAYVRSEQEETKMLLQSPILSWSNLDLHFFDLDDLRARQLLLVEHFPIHLSTGLRRGWSPEDLSSEGRIAKAIGNTHV